MSLLMILGLASGVAVAVLASPGGLNLTLGNHNRENKERWWPVPPARALDSLHHDGRSLQQGKKDTCVRSLLQLVEPAELEVIDAWGKCVAAKVDTFHRQVAGGVFGVYLDCWCDRKVEEVLQEFGCCDHPDFHLLCQAQCPNERNCASAEAQTCIQNCPALCLENDYQPEFCGKGCTSECYKHMGCIVEHSITMTQAGHPDHNQICDVMSFDSSSEWKAWQTCYVAHPKRTHWHRHNAENNCYCESGLKAAAQKAQCCEAKWGKTICDDQCSTAETSIDCEGAEAKSCAEECSRTCSALTEEAMGPECKSTCFDAGSKCAKYSVCQPHGPWEFDYVCDDGAKPMDNGCCMMTSGMSHHLGCPTLCDSWAPHLPQHSVAGVEILHSGQCQCTGCPSTAKAAQAKWSDTLTNNLWEHGIAQLALISKRVGILGPNRKMQELMAERNTAILEAYKALPGMPDAAFEAKVSIIVEDYHTKIEAEAQRFKASGETSVSSGLPSASSASDDEPTSLGLPRAPENKTAQPNGTEDSPGSNTGVNLIIVAITGVLGLFLMFMIVVLVYKMVLAQGRKVGENSDASRGATPYDGDSNVVMGRPVEEGGTDGVAAQGTPVQSGKGLDDNAKDNNDDKDNNDKV